MANRQSRGLKRNGLERGRRIAKSKGDVRPEVIEALVGNVMIDPGKSIGANGRNVIYSGFVRVLCKQGLEYIYDRLM